MNNALIGAGMLLLLLLATLWSEWRQYQAGYWQQTGGQESAMRELIACYLERFPLPTPLAHPRYAGRACAIWSVPASD